MGKDLRVWWESLSKDTIHTNVTVYFGFFDRLRILLGGKVFVQIKTYCEEMPGRVHSESCVNVAPLIPQKQKVYGAVETNGPDTQKQAEPPR